MRKRQLVIVCLSLFIVTLACKTLSGSSETIEPVDPDIRVNGEETVQVIPSIPKPGGVITKVTLARDSDPQTYEAIDPTTKFFPGETIHAVVEVKKAPAETLFSVKWLTIEVSDPTKSDYLIDTTETVQAGTGNLDFTLTPDGQFLPGTYKVEIYVNNKLDQLEKFTIVESE